MTDIEAIRAKIRMLRARTEAAGCTRAEAEAAAMAAMQLMAKYEIPDELADRPPIVRAEIMVGRSRLDRPWIDLYPGVGDATACSVMVDSWDGAVIYRGFEPDVAIAEYLHAVTMRIIEVERKACIASAPYRRRKSTKTRRAYLLEYLGGVIVALRHKLREAGRDAGDGADRAYRLALHEASETTATQPFVPKGKVARSSSAGLRSGLEAGMKHSIHTGVETAAPKLIGRA